MDQASLPYWGPTCTRFHTPPLLPLFFFSSASVEPALLSLSFQGPEVCLPERICDPTLESVAVRSQGEYVTAVKQD